MRVILALIIFLPAFSCTSGETSAPGIGGNGELPFLSECDPTNDLCNGSNNPPEFCFTFNSRGPLCSHGCETDDDCSLPSTGCNGMGICKSPGGNDDDGDGDGDGDGGGDGGGGGGGDGSGGGGN